MENQAAKRGPTWRTHLALLIIVFAAFFGIYQGIQYYNPKIFIKYFQNSKPLPVDTVVRSERLLHCLNEKLDPREVVGFLTDVSGEAHRERFRQAQYALVPVVVDDSVDHRLVVGFFNNPDQLNLNTQEFIPVLECSPGVILFLHIGVQ
jgi:hypothetical protein